MLLLVAGGLSACSRPDPVPEPIRAVKLLAVGQYSAKSPVEYAGEIRAQTESRMGFQVAGKLLRRSVDVGDTVQKGQVLAEIDSQDYVLAAQAAQAQVQAARTQRDLAQADWQRFLLLQTQGFISRVELDRRRAQWDAAQAQLEQAQAQAAAQSNQTSYTKLVATHAGVVTAVTAEPGQVVAAGTPVVQLAHSGPRDVVVSIPEGQLASVRIDGPVQVRLWGQDALLQGRWRELAASADPVTRTYVAKAEIASSTPVSLGATAYVLTDPESEKSTSHLQLPSTAVSTQGGNPVVWRFDSTTSTVHVLPVQVAGVKGNDVLITSELHAGMQLVAAGTHVLSEGQKVSIYQSRYPNEAP
jgi:multidrug efflux system membrane fusion protein